MSAAEFKKGVEIFHTRKLKKLRDLVADPRVSASVRQINSRNIGVITIIDGEAGFFPGGVVDVKLANERAWKVRFEPREVLEIRDLQGNVLAQNHYLCSECYQNSGQSVGTQPGLLHGRVNRVFQCQINPDHYWSRENI